MKIELSKTLKGFDALRFVAIARAKESTRYAIPFVNIEKDCVVGTDGRRLHIVHLEHNWEPGLYEVLKCTKTKIVLLKSEEEGKFPNWESIVPHYQTFFRLGWSPNKPSIAMTMLGKAGVAVNYEYLWDVVTGDRAWDIYYGPADRPIRAISVDYNRPRERFEAVIMPLNIGESELTTKAIRRHKDKIAV